MNVLIHLHWDTHVHIHLEKKHILCLKDLRFNSYFTSLLERLTSCISLRNCTRWKIYLHTYFLVWFFFLSGERWWVGDKFNGKGLSPLSVSNSLVWDKMDTTIAMLWSTCVSHWYLTYRRAFLGQNFQLSCTLCEVMFNVLIMCCNII